MGKENLSLKRRKEKLRAWIFGVIIGGTTLVASLTVPSVTEEIKTIVMKAVGIAISGGAAFLVCCIILDKTMKD